VFWLVMTRSEVDLCIVEPGHEVDVFFDADLSALSRVWLGAESGMNARADWRTALAALTPGFAARAAELSDTDDFVADTALPRRAGRALPPAAGRPAESACCTRGAQNGDLTYGKNCTGADVPLIWLRCMRRTVFLSNSSRRCMVL
jgi:hypothetical protein